MHIDGLLNDLLGCCCSHLFDVDTTLFRDHHDWCLRFAVEDNAEIVFLFNVYFGNDEDFFYF